MEDVTAIMMAYVLGFAYIPRGAIEHMMQKLSWQFSSARKKENLPTQSSEVHGLVPFST